MGADAPLERKRSSLAGFRGALAFGESFFERPKPRKFPIVRALHELAEGDDGEAQSEAMRGEAHLTETKSARLLGPIVLADLVGADAQLRDQARITKGDIESRNDAKHAMIREITWAMRTILD